MTAATTILNNPAKTPAQKRKMVLDVLRMVNGSQRQMVDRWVRSNRRYDVETRTMVPNDALDPALDPAAWDRLAEYSASVIRTFLAVQRYAQQQADELRR